MCLDYDQKITEKIKERFNKSNEIVCYKVFNVSAGETFVNIYSIFQHTDWGFIDVNTRFLKLQANRRVKKLYKIELDTKKINKGIHVFLSKSEAKKWRKRPGYLSSSLFPVICKKQIL